MSSFYATSFARRISAFFDVDISFVNVSFSKLSADEIKVTTVVLMGPSDLPQLIVRSSVEELSREFRVKLSQPPSLQTEMLLFSSFQLSPPPVAEGGKAALLGPGVIASSIASVLLVTILMLGAMRLLRRRRLKVPQETLNLMAATVPAQVQMQDSSSPTPLEKLGNTEEDTTCNKKLTGRQKLQEHVRTSLLVDCPFTSTGFMYRL